MGLNCAVLVIAYNKPEHLARVLEVLSHDLPQKLYVHIDGPKVEAESRETHLRVIETVRSFESKFPRIILKTQSSNLGGRLGVLEALNWFFSNEAAGLIVEEDVLPIGDYSNFTENALQVIDQSPTIKFACLFNPGISSNSAFLLSHWVPWGWATSSKNWQEIQDKIARDGALLHFNLFQLGPRRRIGVILYLNSILEKVKNGQVATWDAEIHAAIISTSAKVIFPKVALSKHIGIGTGATHADSQDWWSEIEFGGSGVITSDLSNLELDSTKDYLFEKIWRMTLISILINRIRLLIKKFAIL